jgi:hypothetical protein
VTALADVSDARFTDAQRDRLAAFEAAQDAPESLVERVAQAIADSDGCDRANWPGMYEERARAAIAAMEPGQ